MPRSSSCEMGGDQWEKHNTIIISMQTEHTCCRSRAASPSFSAARRSASPGAPMPSRSGPISTSSFSAPWLSASARIASFFALAADVYACDPHANAEQSLKVPLGPPCPSLRHHMLHRLNLALQARMLPHVHVLVLEPTRILMAGMRQPDSPYKTSLVSEKCALLVETTKT